MKNDFVLKKEIVFSEVQGKQQSLRIYCDNLALV